MADFGVKYNKKEKTEIVISVTIIELEATTTQTSERGRDMRVDEVDSVIWPLSRR